MSEVSTLARPEYHIVIGSDALPLDEEPGDGCMELISPLSLGVGRPFTLSFIGLPSPLQQG